MAELDEKDRKILRILEENSRTPLKEIAKKTDIPITTVYNRLMRFKREKLVRFTIIPDYKKLGYGVESYVLIKIQASPEIDPEQVLSKVIAVRGVKSAALVTGSVDLIAHIYSKSVDELSDIIMRDIRKIKGVLSTETLVVLKKKNSKLPI